MVGLYNDLVTLSVSIKLRLDKLPGLIYNKTMKERVGKVSRNEARRKAESAALFQSMLKAPHLIQTPKQYKGTRQSNKAKAIKESWD